MKPLRAAIATAATIVAAAALWTQASWAQVPQRVVSLNLCTDELALQLADPGTVVSVSFLARDPTLSTVAEQARAVPTNRGLLEQIVLLKPDLVLAHRYSGRVAIDGLRRLGYRVVEIDAPRDLEGVRRQIADIAEALGRPERGQRMIATLDARLAALPPPPRRRPTAVVYQPNGFAFGHDSLGDTILQMAGLQNFGGPQRIYARVSLEALLADPPDLLVSEESDGDRRSMGQQFLAHPALLHQFPAEARIEMPRRLWLCAGLNVAAAAEFLAQARLRLGWQ